MNTGDVVIDMPSDPLLEHTNTDPTSRTPDAMGYLDPPQARQHSRGITALTIDSPDSDSSRRSPASRPPPRWKTAEFMFYGLVFMIAIPMMVWKPIQLSQSSHPQYGLYKRRLSPGWMFGRKIDNSDTQYRSFRDNIPALGILAGAFLMLKRLYSRFALSSRLSSPNNLLYRIPFLCAFSLLMLVGLHGSSALKVLLILCLNFGIARACGASKLNPLLTWIFNMAVLFGIERNSGYSFASISPSLGYLDKFQGVYPRWYISFNITMLRLVSYNMDYFWACHHSVPIDNGPPPSNLKQRTTAAHPLEIYSLTNYLAYILYPPLYIAGPIMTFNDFMWQHRRQTSVPPRSMVISYLIRFFACLFTMELILHFMYVVAIKDTSAWQGDTPFELSMIGFWNLIIVWLKLLIPWRFFRLWALADGIDPPENMIRCMANNYSALGFWRSWHRSYNLWIIRYIYIPLGGTKNLIYSSVLIFSFVALWHDLTFKLLAWGWLVSLFFVPEILAQYLLPGAKYGTKPWYRHVCALGGVVNVLAMMSANLIGFAIGMKGMSYMIHELSKNMEGLMFLLVASCVLFVGVQVMFEYREEEMRRGVYRKC